MNLPVLEVSASTPGYSLCPDLHTEVSRSWNKSYSARLFSPKVSHYSNVVGMNECSYGKIPWVEDTLVGYISSGGASSLKARYYPKSLFGHLRLGWVKHIRQQVRLEAVRTRWWCCRHIRLTCLKREMILEIRILLSFVGPRIYHSVPPRRPPELLGGLWQHWWLHRDICG